VSLSHPGYPTNTWRLRKAVRFNFPPGLVVAPDGYVLVVSFNPAGDPEALAGFRSRYRVASEVAIVGPYDGKLNNASDSVELYKPDEPQPLTSTHPGLVPYILVDRVQYSDFTPWPPAADGYDMSLQRLNDAEYGNDPVNWTATTPTPGPQASALDSDGDGMPDSWETANNLDPFNPADAASDSDGDGLTNLQEFQAGTNPHDSQSVLRFQSIVLAVSGESVVLTFSALANQTYTLEAIDALSGGAWAGVHDVDAALTNRLIHVTLPATAPMRFYRVRTPWRRGQQGALRINSIEPVAGTGEFLLTCSISANQACAVETIAELSSGPWTAITHCPAAPSNRVVQVVAPAAGAKAFFRLRAENGQW
jgi:hypothetical protein